MDSVFFYESNLKIALSDVSVEIKGKVFYGHTATVCQELLSLC